MYDNLVVGASCLILWLDIVPLSLADTMRMYCCHDAILPARSLDKEVAGYTM